MRPTTLKTLFAIATTTTSALPFSSGQNDTRTLTIFHSANVSQTIPVQIEKSIDANDVSQKRGSTHHAYHKLLIHGQTSTIHDQHLSPIHPPSTIYSRDTSINQVNASEPYDPKQDFHIYPGNPKVYYGPPFVPYKQNKKQAKVRHKELLKKIHDRYDEKLELLKQMRANQHKRMQEEIEAGHTVIKLVEIDVGEGGESANPLSKEEKEKLLKKADWWVKYTNIDDMDFCVREMEKAKKSADRFLKKDIGIKCRMTKDRC